MVNPLEEQDKLDEIGNQIGLDIMEAVRLWDNSRARSQQSAKRILGMSQLGGCREYIRAEIAGDPKVEPVHAKWPAIIGTWTGDGIESAVLEFIPGATTQGLVSVTLPKTKIKVTGHTDIRFGRNRLIDLKSKDGTAVIRTEGPPFKEVVQVSGYLTGLIQSGEMDADATAHLVYFDRSGKDRKMFVVSISAETALSYLAMAEERLEEVAAALASGVGGATSYLRDEPESYCWHIQCPFYNACWAGYDAEGKLTEAEEALVKQYDKGRAMAKDAKNLQEDAKHQLGTDPDHLTAGEGKEFKLKWTSKFTTRGEEYFTIDVRETR